MPTLLEAALQIVLEREHAYHEILADLYFMALLARDQDQSNEIWQEALAEDHYPFLLLLLETRRLYATSYRRPPSPFRRHTRSHRNRNRPRFHPH